MGTPKDRFRLVFMRQGLFEQAFPTLARKKRKRGQPDLRGYFLREKRAKPQCCNETGVCRLILPS